MNILNLMTSWWMWWAIKAHLQKIGISAKDMEWVDFTNMDSLNQFAQRIVPWLLKKNPEVAQKIKESWRLQGQTKQDVETVINWL